MLEMRRNISLGLVKTVMGKLGYYLSFVFFVGHFHDQRPQTLSLAIVTLTGALCRADRNE